jgi:putative glutamine amidotransferase
VPLPIGITASESYDVSAYEQAVKAAGANPVVLRPRPGAAHEAESIAALVLAGGEDVEPRRYGFEPPPELASLVSSDQDRDHLEWELLDLALRRRLPVLGICRGIQVLNAYCGGTIYVDLPVAGFNTVDHRQRPRLGEPVHQVQILGGRLQQLMGEETAVNSCHHQAARDPAPDLLVTARSQDGLIEALESQDGRLLGVQWHPEMLIERSSAARALFVDLVDRADVKASRM